MTGVQTCALPILPGSVTLIGGDPGIGKSTLLLQTLVQLAQDQKVLYVTGEESLQQVSLRAHRLGLEASTVRDRKSVV